MIETAKVLYVHGKDEPSAEKGENLLFENFDID